MAELSIESHCSKLEFISFTPTYPDSSWCGLWFPARSWKNMSLTLITRVPKKCGHHVGIYEGRWVDWRKYPGRDFYTYSFMRHAIIMWQMEINMRLEFLIPVSYIRDLQTSVWSHSYRWKVMRWEKVKEK